MQRDASVWTNLIQNLFKNYGWGSWQAESPWEGSLLCPGVASWAPQQPKTWPLHSFFWDHSRTGNDIKIEKYCNFFKSNFYIFIYWKFYFFTFREREREAEWKGEKHQCVVASHTSPPGDMAHNPGMCPDQESNQQLFGSKAGAQSTEPQQPVLKSNF